MPANKRRTRKRNPSQQAEEDGLLEKLCSRVIGQDKAMRAIVPYVQMHHAGLSPEGRPAGVFLLLGPTGTGKTKTVEALADVLHGNPQNLVRVDCGEYGRDHEVAKLTGAPPGYLGHRETPALLTQARLSSVTSRSSDISIVLFDEIEKAAPSLTILLLGILDKAQLRLGDNNLVNFDRSLVFLTSNLGAQGIMKALGGAMGFAAAPSEAQVAHDIENSGMQAVRKHFSPEFVNRIDAALTYEPLGEAALRRILDLELAAVQAQIQRRMGVDAFLLDVLPGARNYLLERGTSPQYGARELKRTVHKHVIQPLAAMLCATGVPYGSAVTVGYSKARQGLVLRAA